MKFTLMQTRASSFGELVTEVLSIHVKTKHGRVLCRECRDRNAGLLQENLDELMRTLRIHYYFVFF